MQRIITRLAIFMLLCFLLDQAIGACGVYLYTHARKGYTQHNYYVGHKMLEDVIILGSSRAARHYDPSIISDSTGLSCYNCGVDGMGIIHDFGKLQMIEARYMPKMIVIDVVADFSLAKNDNLKYITYLKLDYAQPSVKRTVAEIAPEERWKMYCESYKYNSQWLKLLKDNMPLHPELTTNGYAPLHGILPYNITDRYIPEDEIITDSVKIKYLRQIIETFHEKTLLVFTISPQYKAPNSENYNVLKQLCAEYNIPLLDFYTHSISQEKRFWTDVSHLNKEGAEKYSAMIAGELKQVLMNSRKHIQ